MTGAAGPDGSGGPHAFVDDLDLPVLEEADRHHLERVLRLRAGDALTVSDGAGGWRPCRFGAEVEPDGEVVRLDAPRPRLTVAFALVKGSRPELVVQKLTELGIDVIRPFAAERSVVRWGGGRAEVHHQRLVRVAREACSQSRRCFLPEVAEPVPFAAVAALPGAVRTDRGAPPPAGTTTVLVGPEGGWSDAERAALPAAVGLGPHVLRAETAAIAAGTLLAALRHGLVDPAQATQSGHPPEADHRM